MGFENKAGLGVNNQYGARDTGGAVGLEHSYGSKWFVDIDLTGQSIADAIAGFIPPVVIPKGALFKAATLRVDEAFTTGGTSPVVNIGAVAAPGTNGITVTGAELGTVGTKVPASTGNGTWAQSSTTGTASASKIGIALGGTSPTVTAGVGKASLILEYVFKTKV